MIQKCIRELHHTHYYPCVDDNRLSIISGPQHVFVIDADPDPRFANQKTWGYRVRLWSMGRGEEQWTYQPDQSFIEVVEDVTAYLTNPEYDQNVLWGFFATFSPTDEEFMAYGISGEYPESDSRLSQLTTRGICFPEAGANFRATWQWLYSQL